MQKLSLHRGHISSDPTSDRLWKCRYLECSIDLGASIVRATSRFHARVPFVWSPVEFEAERVIDLISVIISITNINC